MAVEHRFRPNSLLDDELGRHMPLDVAGGVRTKRIETAMRTHRFLQWMIVLGCMVGFIQQVSATATREQNTAFSSASRIKPFSSSGTRRLKYGLRTRQTASLPHEREDENSDRFLQQATVEYTNNDTNDGGDESRIVLRPFQIRLAPTSEPMSNDELDQFGTTLESLLTSYFRKQQQAFPSGTVLDSVLIGVVTGNFSATEGQTILTSKAGVALFRSATSENAGALRAIASVASTQGRNSTPTDDEALSTPLALTPIPTPSQDQVDTWVQQGIQSSLIPVLQTQSSFASIQAADYIELTSDDGTTRDDQTGGIVEDVSSDGGSSNSATIGLVIGGLTAGVVAATLVGLFLVRKRRSRRQRQVRLDDGRVIGVHDDVDIYDFNSNDGGKTQVVVDTHSPTASQRSTQASQDGSSPPSTPNHDLQRQGRATSSLQASSPSQLSPSLRTTRQANNSNQSLHIPIPAVAVPSTLSTASSLANYSVQTGHRNAVVAESFETQKIANPRKFPEPRSPSSMSGGPRHSPSRLLGDDAKSFADSDSEWTVATEAGDSTILKTLPSSTSGGSPSLVMMHGQPTPLVTSESFERPVNLRKDMLTSPWSGMVVAGGAGSSTLMALTSSGGGAAPPQILQQQLLMQQQQQQQSDSVLKPSHFSASQERMMRMQEQQLHEQQQQQKQLQYPFHQPLQSSSRNSSNNSSTNRSITQRPLTVPPLTPPRLLEAENNISGPDDEESLNDGADSTSFVSPTPSSSSTESDGSSEESLVFEQAYDEEGEEVHLHHTSGGPTHPPSHRTELI